MDKNSHINDFIIANYGTIKNTIAQPGLDAKEVFYGAIDVIWQFHKIAFAVLNIYMEEGEISIKQIAGPTGYSLAFRWIVTSNNCL